MQGGMETAVAYGHVIHHSQLLVLPFRTASAFASTEFGFSLLTANFVPLHSV